MDKIIKFLLMSLSALFIVCIIFIGVPSILSFPSINENNNSVSDCGLTKINSLGVFREDIFYPYFFTIPYNFVRISETNYSLLKNGKQPTMMINKRKTLSDAYYGYYSNILFYENQSDYYRSILNGFQKLKQKYDLDDDEYLQLVVTSIQAMPYYTNNGDVKYPIITYSEGCGDCDDKSFLLVTLLSQENYNVSLFIIPPYEKYLTGSHAMAGIASHSARFTKNGYAMIETTKKGSLIGEFPIYASSEKVLVIKIGNGTKTYETYSVVSIFPNGTRYKEIKKGDTVSYRTLYTEGFDLLSPFRNIDSLQ